MGSITDFLENELLDHVLNEATYTSPANIYLALCTADPTDAATGASMNEHPNSGNYARTAISFGLAASRTVTQDAVVTFPTASGDWSTVSHWAITDGNTHGAGNVLAHGALNASKSVLSGDTPSVASGEVVIAFSAGEISDFLADELLDHCFNNAAYTPPTTTYIGLTTATVSDNNTGSTITEVSGGSYARELVDLNGGSSPTWNLASSGVVDNAAPITFTTATASWGTVTSVVICDALTLGNLLFYDNDVTDKAVDTDDTAEIGTGDLDVALT